MKLSFATNASPYGAAPLGGAETSCRLLARMLAARGHEVLYLARDVDAAQVGAAAEEGVELRILAGDRSRKGRLRTALQFATLFRRERIDIFYSFYEPDILRPALRARRLAPHTRVVMRLAGLHWYETCRREPRQIPRYRRLFQAVDAVNVISEPLVALSQEKLRELGMGAPFRRTFVADIGSGAPVRSTPYAGLPPSPFRMVMAARFSSYQKRQDILVEALALIPPDQRVELILVGDGTRRASIEKRIDELRLTARIRLVPFLPQDELWALLSRQHLLCHCVEYEGLGKTIIESMALGLPVLASAVPVIESYVRYGENGFLVPNTPEAWAEGIMALMDDPAARARVSAAGRAFATRHHDPELNVGLYEAAFAAIAAS